MKGRVVQACSIVDYTQYIRWLIDLMSDDKLARLAGESFSLNTGLDLAYLDLERLPPEGVELGPNDNLEDENVAMDEDDGLPWPDQEGIERRWLANQLSFPKGTRSFMGKPLTREHCIHVLKEGTNPSASPPSTYAYFSPAHNCSQRALRHGASSAG